jgi:hypothetical protein
MVIAKVAEGKTLLAPAVGTGIGDLGLELISFGTHFFRRREYSVGDGAGFAATEGDVGAGCEWADVPRA